MLHVGNIIPSGSTSEKRSNALRWLHLHEPWDPTIQLGDHKVIELAEASLLHNLCQMASTQKQFDLHGKYSRYLSKSATIVFIILQTFCENSQHI